MAQIEPGRREELGRGYVLLAPFRATAVRLEPTEPGTRARETVTDTFDNALARNGMQSVATVEVTDIRPEAGVSSDLRDTRGDEALLLETPDLGPETGQVVVAVDEAGTVTWNFPLEDNNQIQPPDRSTGDRKRFRIRTYSPPVPDQADARDRSLFGSIGKKLLKVIVYPITDRLIGKAASEIAEHWEGKNRTYGVRDFATATYRDATGKDLTTADVGTLAQGQALLFIHGTFSTAHGAFADVPPDLMKTLHERYGGRVFAFNHFTLSHDPARNVRWLSDRLRDLSADSRLKVDVICHSRGGIVARCLAHGHETFMQDRVSVRRLIFVAAPNNGTALTEPDHVVEMIDRLTSALNFIPPGGVADVLDGILIAVKIVGHGALTGLAGLQSMNRRGDFLPKLRGNTSSDYFAVSANYEPSDPGLKGLVKTVADAALDRVFKNEENDLVVPERGVYEGSTADGFPIAANHVLRIPKDDAVWHTKLFGHPKVAAKIGEWLA